MPARRSLAGLALRQLALVAVLALLVGGALIATGSIVLPYRYDPFATLDLARPPDWLTSFRLRRLKADPDICHAALAQAGISHRRLPDRQGPEGCGLSGAVDLASEATDLGVPVTATCSVAASWVLFERNVLQPAAKTHLGHPVRRVEHLGTYACRRIAGAQARWSQHATANAIDITAFVLADGSRITLLRDWAGEDREARFLVALRNGACASFNGVLGPDYNAAHADHFHFDNGPYRICQ